MLAGCTSSCELDPTPCEATGKCGDGVITPGWEACDGADLGDQDCISLGHHGGQLACTADCRVDASGCSRCGDGIVQETAGELMESNMVSCLDDGYFCGFDRRSWDFDGTTLLVGGTYDRAAGFCSDHEVTPGTLPVPLHACGIFLVRLELPGAF